MRLQLIKLKLRLTRHYGIYLKKKGGYQYYMRNLLDVMCHGHTEINNVNYNLRSYNLTTDLCQRM